MVKKLETALTAGFDAKVYVDAADNLLSILASDEDGGSYRLVFDAQTAVNLSSGFLRSALLQNEDAKKPVHSFETRSAAVITGVGGTSRKGAACLHLSGVGMDYETIIGPELLGTIGTAITIEMSKMTVPPETWRDDARLTKPVSGAVTSGEIVTHFGQDYPKESLELLGVFLIRANLLESALVRLLSFLSDLRIDRAEAIFYSSSNHKARLDIIRSLISASGLSDEMQGKCIKHLDTAKKLAAQRNALVHGEWTFKKDGFEVIEKRGGQKAKKQNRIAGHRELKDICKRYNDLELLLEVFISEAAQSMAANTA